MILVEKISWNMPFLLTKVRFFEFYLFIAEDYESVEEDEELGIN
jgi:hypothetical protein